MTSTALTAALLCSTSCLYGSLIDEMSLEEKVGQLLMAHFHGEEANEDAKTLIQDVHVGSIIYYNWANSLSSPRQVRKLSSGLQTLTLQTSHKIPLAIATDQEGGLIARLTNGFTIFPGNKALGMTNTPELARKCACAMGEEARQVGVTWILGPVVDVNRPENPVIGIRSFGEDGREVAQFAAQACYGYQDAKIKTCAKHAIGQGFGKTDPHYDFSVVDLTKEELERQDLPPFIAVRDLVDAIMVGHLVVKAIDPDTVATFSQKVVKYIRAKGFNKLLVTDSLVMEGLLKHCESVDEAAVKALQAGYDMLILGGKVLLGTQDSLELTVQDVKRIHGHILDAVHEGRLSMDRINEAVKRVLAFKQGMPRDVDPQKVPPSVSTPEHRELARIVAEKALRSTGKKPEILSCTLFAPDILKDSLDTTSFPQKVNITYFSSLNPTDQDQKSMLETAKKTNTIIICTYNAWKNPAQKQLVQSLIDLGKPVVVIETRDPLDAPLFQGASYIITTYSPTTPSLQAAANNLFD